MGELNNIVRVEILSVRFSFDPVGNKIQTAQPATKGQHEISDSLIHEQRR
jgi:hypothetical protein